MHFDKVQNIKKCDYMIVSESNRDAWEFYLKQTAFSNLLQSWNYGEAKAKSDGWIVRRGIITKNNVSVALCQWLEKSIFKFIRIIRVNRGPIFLKNQATNEEKLSIYRFIKDYFCIFKGNFLFIAPALENNTEHTILLKNLGYKKNVKLIPWKSALINLKKTELELRDALRPRLRNYLKRTEAANFIFECSTKKTDFIGLIDRYIQLQKEKNFSGIKVDCVNLLYDLDNQNGDVLMSRVKNKNDELMAELFLVIHGNQCTYLIAWTSSEGAKTYAMYFLMWNTMLDLKARGVSYFDVGGYNEQEHSSICQFKKGFGGDEYCLIGEYRGFL